MEEKKSSMLLLAGIAGLIIYFTLKSKKAKAQGNRILVSEQEKNPSIVDMKDYSGGLKNIYPDLVSTKTVDYIGPFKVTYS